MPAAQELLVPRRLGPYLIGRKLGAGGMATVFAARQEGKHVKRLVALKVLSANVSKEDEEHRAFVREALVATRLEHPHIVRTYDVGEVEGTLYLAMELVHGASLSACTKASEGPVPIPIALKIIDNIARALHAAHELEDPERGHLGVVHQDVSPQNILIGYDGSIKLVDFGVARFGTLEGSRTESLRGKPSYASPEQIAGKNIDRRTDVFALGVILWELLTGARLFKRETSAATYLAVLQDPIPDVRDVNPYAPDDLAHAVAKALERERDKRWATADEFRTAIVHARERNGLKEATAEKLATWVASLVAPTMNPAELEREIVKADTSLFTPAKPIMPVSPPEDTTERSPFKPQDAAADAIVPDLDLPGVSQTRPTAQPRRQAPTDAMAEKATVQPASSADLAEPPPPSSRRGLAQPQRQMKVETPSEDWDMHIERDIASAAMVNAQGSYGMQAAIPRTSVRTASTNLELASSRRDISRSRVEEPSAVAKIVPVLLAAVGFLGFSALFITLAHHPSGMPVKRMWPHAFDGTSATSSGAVSVTTLILAVAAGYAGVKLRPRSWALVATATGLLLTALAMVTVTLASGEAGTPPDGVMLLPFLVPVALLGLGLDLAMRARILFRSASSVRKIVGGPLIVVAALFAYLAYETSFLVMR